MSGNSVRGNGRVGAKFLHRAEGSFATWRMCAAVLTSTVMCVSDGWSAVLISQYYEGTSNNKWIELHNTGDAAVNLSTDSYRIGLWSNASRELWKTSGAPSASFSLSGYIPAGGVFTLANSAVALPLAPARANVVTSGSTTHVINFNGDDSVVVYQNPTFAFSNVVDALGFTGTTAADTSYSRKTSITSGTNADFVSGDWDTLTNAAVNSATPTSDSYIAAYNRGGIAVTWDSNTTSAGTGGSGDWDTSAKLTSRQSGTGVIGDYYAWDNTTNARDAILFGGTAGNVTVSGAKTLGAMMFATSGYVVSGNTLTFDGTGNIDVIGAATTATVSAPISTSASVNVRKLGSGKLILSANNTYAGLTTVQQGNLLVNGTHSGGGAFTVKSGATLSGTGSTGAPVTVESGGTLAPGASIEDLGTGNLILNGGATFLAEANFIELGSSSADQVDVTGTVTLGDGVSSFPQLTFVATFVGQPGNSHTFVLVDNDSAGDTISASERFAGGTPVSSPPNATHAFDYIVGLLNYRVSYNANNVNGLGDGNDIVIEFTQVPEPSTLWMLAAAGALRRRRRAL